MVAGFLRYRHKFTLNLSPPPLFHIYISQCLSQSLRSGIDYLISSCSARYCGKCRLGEHTASRNGLQLITEPQFLLHFCFSCPVERTNLLREFTPGCAYLPLYRISYASLYIYPTYRNIFYLNRAGRTHTAV